MEESNPNPFLNVREAGDFLRLRAVPGELESRIKIPSFPRTRESRLSTSEIVESLDSRVRARVSGESHSIQKAVIPNTRVAQRNK